MWTKYWEFRITLSFNFSLFTSSTLAQQSCSLLSKGLGNRILRLCSKNVNVKSIREYNEFEKLRKLLNRKFHQFSCVYQISCIFHVFDNHHFFYKSLFFLLARGWKRFIKRQFIFSIKPKPHSAWALAWAKKIAWILTYGESSKRKATSWF